ncbi:MAG TPA: hypothetical protein VMT82_04960 [candidate division Zixibacteria bacterium]|nr:hypothetical protein [candidate division Zixibacteria bacterium]
MEADWSVELGADDPVLEMPWSSPDGVLRWQDLRCHSELIPQLAECNTHPEFIEPLRTLNSPGSGLLTAKCDAFTPEPTEPAEEVFGSWRMVSYIDLLFAGAPPDDQNAFAPGTANFDFALHEQFARDFCACFNRDPESAINAVIELVIRRCIYKGSHESSDARDGFYFTVYVIGYGESGEGAREEWSAALKEITSHLSTWSI